MPASAHPGEDDSMSDPDDFLADKVKVPYFAGAGRILFAPDFTRQGLAVPLDGAYVVPELRDRTPYGWLADAMAKEKPRYAEFAEGMAAHGKEFGDVPQDGIDRDGVSPYFANRYFHWGDALALTTVLHKYNPQRYFEIGSGNSTRFARRAITKCGLQTKITCIDPNPRASVSAIADRWIGEGVTRVDTALFSELEPGDVLMLDGSHLVFHGTDTTHVFLRILPLLPKGVIFHVHDVFLPFEYLRVHDHLYYNEQYLLAALFVGGKPVSDIIAPLQYMHSEGLCAEGASFWMMT